MVVTLHNKVMIAKMKIIDPHIHLFNLEQGQYFWLKAESPPFWPDKSIIHKSFNEAALTLAPAIELFGFVHIEAGFDNEKPWRELITLESSCHRPFRAISAINLTDSSENFKKHLAKLAKCQSFVGVRHIFDEQALSLLTQKQVIENFNTLNNFAANLGNQRLVFESQLPLFENNGVSEFCKVIKENTQIRFIINHGGFPPSDADTNEWRSWQNNLRKLSLYSHVAIKCSGWEMVERKYKQAWINKSLTSVFNIFGVKRVMLASNFPLCLFSKSSYYEYWQSIINSQFFTGLTEVEKSALCYDNALHWYFIK